MNPEQIVQLQLEAYNRKDLDAFVSFYSKGVIIRNLSEETSTLTGRNKLRERYERLFAESDKLHAQALSRLSFGNFVLDEELVHGLSSFPGGLRIGVIYQIEMEMISSVWFTR